MALHAAQFSSVSYHVEPAPQAGAQAVFSAFPVLTRASSVFYGSAERPVTGYLAYSSFLDAWSSDGAFHGGAPAHRLLNWLRRLLPGRSTSTSTEGSLISPHARAILFQHDEAFLFPSTLKAWLEQTVNRAPAWPPHSRCAPLSATSI